MPFILFLFVRVSIILTYDTAEEVSGRLLKKAVQRDFHVSLPFFRGVAEAALYCARPTRAFSSRALREHGDRPSHPAPFFSSRLKDFSILTRVHPRLIRKTEGRTVGIAGVVEIDAIVPADSFHCDFKGNGLGV